MAPSIRNLTIKPSMAWLLVFMPALSYFVATRLQSSGFRWGRSNSLGETVTSTLQLVAPQPQQSQKDACAALSDIFFTSRNDCETLQNTFNLLYRGRGMKNIVASTWKHDSELGRGYLLVSQSHGSGRIWRWEVGGGPIAIGRSLHLEASGCRSKYFKSCDNEDEQVGSGGMAIDFHSQEHYSEGSLVVAEWGEGRIVRMEESTGARTPLVIQVPNVCGNSDTATTTTTMARRLHQPRSLLFTPFGDLLVADTNPLCQKAAVYRLPRGVHVDSLDSLTESRQAHSWNETKHSSPVEMFYQGGVQSIGGFAIDPTWLSMLMTVKTKDGQVLLLRASIVTDDDDDDDDDKQDDNTSDSSDDVGTTTKDDSQEAEERDLMEETTYDNKSKGIMDQRTQIVMDMTKELGISHPGPLVVSKSGYIFTAVPNGIAILASSTSGKIPTASLLGYLATPEPPTSLTLGEDKFLYSFSGDSMFRVRVREGPVNIPTNLVVGKSQ